MDNKELNNNELENIDGGSRMNLRSAIFRCKACSETTSVPVSSSAGFSTQNIDCPNCGGKQTASFVKYTYL